jgi:hypothetical protein
MVAFTLSVGATVFVPVAEVEASSEAEAHNAHTAAIGILLAILDFMVPQWNRRQST